MLSFPFFSQKCCDSNFFYYFVKLFRQIVIFPLYTKMEIDLSPKVAEKFVCKLCHYNCSKESDYKKHITTRKHKWNESGNVQAIAETDKIAAAPFRNSAFLCLRCKKNYKTNSGLWKHSKKCQCEELSVKELSVKELSVKELSVKELSVKELSVKELSVKELSVKEENPIELNFLTNLVLEVVKNNAELQKQNQEFQKQMLELCKTSNVHNNHSHNKTFNMQVFLNEQCKDAMNIMDFVNNMTLELSDLEDVGEVGYVEGISKIIIRKLNELDVCKRPIHCSDFKREIMYVRDMDVWTKENNTFDKIRKAIKYVTKKNSDLLIPWIQKYPSGMNIQHPHNDIYMRLMNQAMGGRESFLESENKIIKKISKAVQIDKSYKC
jgi:hypothetical protein